MATVSLPAKEMSKLEALSELPSELALREAAPILVRLTRDPVFLDAHILPLLEEVREAWEWHVARQWGGQDSLYSLQVFVWPPGSRTQIHDHTCWGAYYCAVGSILEERYERLDDGSRPAFARLKKIWQLTWSREDGVSTVLPYEQGIHRVGNLGTGTVISVHLYGPQVGELDGRDYDPSRNYVCDRLEV